MSIPDPEQKTLSFGIVNFFVILSVTFILLCGKKEI